MRFIALLALLFLAPSCLFIPVPEKCVSGEEVTPEELSSIEPGKTTKSEIIERLGNPDVLWLDENIFAYNWKTVWAIMPWFVAGGYQAAGGIEEFTKDYVLLIQFDQNDSVARFERLKRSMFTSYGAMLKSWANHDNESGPGDKDSERQ